MMHTPRRFSLLFSLIIVIAALLILTTISSPNSTIQAASSSTAWLQYEEIYDLLEDGTVLITRMAHPPQVVSTMMVCTQPPPVLIEPADNSQLDTLIPDYQWQQVSANVFRYRLQLSRQPDFSLLDENVVFRTSNPSPGAIMDGFSRSNLLPDTLYYWRVATVCEDTDELGAFSGPYSFRTAPPGGVILPAPILLTPEDGATVIASLVTFALAPVDDAVKYQYRFYRSPDDDWDSWFRLMIRSDTSTSAGFDPNETFYWRAAAVNSYAVGEPSAQWSFVTMEGLKVYLPTVIK